VAGLYVFESNRVERLVAALVEYFQNNKDPDPMATEQVVVPGQAVAQYLSLQLAMGLGVCANVDFPFPGSFFRSAVVAALQATGCPCAAEAWDPEPLTLALLEVLPKVRHKLHETFATASGPDEVVTRKEWWLARTLARIFDDYATNRPEWLKMWSQGSARGTKAALEESQATIYQALCEHIGSPHPMSRLEDAIKVLRDRDIKVPLLPRRLCVFAVTAIPEPLFRVMLALSNRLEMRLFILSPSDKYFGDMLVADEVQVDLRRHGSDLERHHYGNPLLQASGKIFRGLHRMMHDEAADVAVEWVEGYEEPGASMLGTVQSDCLHLVHRGEDEPPVPCDRPDGSIRLFACPGPMRQVEVLRDQILHLLARDPTLDARDILVMAPAFDEFVPLIDAVFLDGDKDPTKAASNTGFPEVPYSIAGQSTLDPATEVVIRVLELTRSRFKASEVLDLLAMEPVRLRFGMDSDDLEAARKLVTLANIRWGIDEGHRQAHGQPADRANTWRFGLDRLFLGVATEEELASVLPVPGIEGTRTTALGRLTAFFERLVAIAHKVQGAASTSSFTPHGAHRTLVEWHEIISEILASFLLPSADQEPLREACQAMVSHAETARSARPVDLETIIATLKYTRSSSTAGFLRGGVNFCPLSSSAASLPFKVICLLGMDDAKFPRRNDRPSFDLIGQHRGSFDLCARDEDRHAFLQAILSARQALLILWNGRDQRTNCDIPPAVPVGEFLDVLAETFTNLGRDALVSRPPLHPFSIENFTAEEKSFDRRAYQAATSRSQAAKVAPLAIVLKPPEEWVASPEDLTRFFKNPIKFLMERRLGTKLDEEQEVMEDRVPVVLDGLEKWKVGDAVFDALLAGTDIAVTRSRLRMQGMLPVGSLGQCLLDEVENDARRARENAARLMAGTNRLVVVDLKANGVSVRGTLNTMWGDVQVIPRYGHVHTHKVLSAWIHHLLAAVCDPLFSGHTYLIGSDKSDDWHCCVEFSDCPGTGASLAERARVHLDDLLELFKTGSMRPLLFFPSSGLVFVSEGGNRSKASAEWKSNPHSGGEGSDPYVQFMLGKIDPWAKGVTGVPDELTPEALAKRVFGPLLECVSRTSGG